MENRTLSAIDKMVLTHLSSQTIHAALMCVPVVTVTRDAVLVFNHIGTLAIVLSNQIIYHTHSVTRHSIHVPLGGQTPDHP